MDRGGFFTARKHVCVWLISMTFSSVRPTQKRVVLYVIHSRESLRPVSARTLCAALSMLHYMCAPALRVRTFWVRLKSSQSVDDFLGFR